MEISNVTIVVRGTKGEVKKAIFDADGTLMQGDMSVLVENDWRPNPPRPIPLEPIDIETPAAKPADLKVVDDASLPDFDVSDLPAENDVPDED